MCSRRQAVKDSPLVQLTSDTTIIERMFAIDSRALCGFRITIALVLLSDLAIRATDLRAMYTDDGMFSRVTICRYYSSFWNWSFHFGSGAWSYQAFLFLIAAVAGIALLVGYQARLATIVCWAMVTSVQDRVPAIMQGADNLLRMLIFWGMFLPLGAVGSVDSLLAKRRGLNWNFPRRVLSVASAAILLQMAMMYFFSAIFKSNADWMYGTAIGKSLTHAFYAKPIGIKLLAFPWLLKGLTIFVFILEWIGPLLLFLPQKKPVVRTVVALLLASMHLAIVMLLNVGLFSYVSLCGLILFVPTFVWDRLERWANFRKVSQVDTQVPHDMHSTLSRYFLQAKISQAICGFALLYSIFLNLNGLPATVRPWAPLVESEFLTIGVGLGQKWNMFAESPSRSGWYVARAKLRNGDEVDLLRAGLPVTWERPRSALDVYPNHRWLKCFREMSYSDEMGFQVFRQPVAQYLGRNWNEHHVVAEQIASLDLIFCRNDDATMQTSAADISRESFARVLFNDSQ
ncbi:MAG: HTTM domain-containing protein [Planctomycetales bacterium]|nr:HTTM domain-containing protein [Planctomycetales bacterium]